jgi:hypothetical protein
MRTSRHGRADPTAGTVFLDALVALLITAVAIPAALVGIAGIIRSSASLAEMVREALQTDSALVVIYEAQQEVRR